MILDMCLRATSIVVFIIALLRCKRYRCNEVTAKYLGVCQHLGAKHPAESLYASLFVHILLYRACNTPVVIILMDYILKTKYRIEAISEL